MAVLDSVQFEQLVSEVKTKLLAESQGVGEVEVVNTLDNINSLPALRGEAVVEAPLELLARPAVEAANRVDEAIANANDTADHPTYIGEDNYVYVWDKSTKTYNKTSIYVRGESFSISKVYASIGDMEADTTHGLKEGDFVLINTNDVENPDNAKIYVLDADGNFVFLVDLSGAIGFTGKTPQFEIGAVTIGVDRADSSVSLEPNGTDADGNPKFKINLKIPSVALKDLTDEEIILLQSPANEMVSVLEETDNAVKNAEELRVSAEESRVEAEESRVEAETLRAEAETSRTEAETLRASAEELRIEAEKTRVEAETLRVEAESLRATEELSRKDSESARVLAETNRASAESDRSVAEVIRQANENTRLATEEVRKTNETERVSAESARREAETLRQSDESVRLRNELSRVEADNARKNDYAVLRADIIAATENANDAASESRNTPIIRTGTWWIWDVKLDEYTDSGTPATSKSPQIQNGTWWVWDDDKGAYKDSGQSVSADYVLTREKIEGVFQGDVSSHWHDRYVDKVEGKQLSTEDFTTEEKKKLAGLFNYDDSALSEQVRLLEENMPTKVSELENDSQYITSSELEDKQFAYAEDVVESLGKKQDSNLYFNGIQAVEWVLDNTYKDFKYHCDLPCVGVTGDMYAEVVFGLDNAMSGDFAPICETGEGFVRIWAVKSKETEVPTIIVHVGNA